VINTINRNHFKLSTLVKSGVVKLIKVQTGSKAQSFEALWFCGWMKESLILV